MEIYRLGIDLAKQNFEICGVDRLGKVLLRKTVKRSRLAEFIAQLPCTIICMEACGGSNYWARKFLSHGHQVQLIPAQYVKAFVKSQKNDRNDALAITEASARPTMNFVSIKQTWQQDIQSLHRVRSRIVGSLTTLRNQMRGLLAEYGIVISQGMSQFNKSIPSIIEDADNELSGEMRELIFDLFEEYKAMGVRKQNYDKMIERISRTNELCRKLTEVPGVGSLTSTAFVAHIGDPGFYKNGRQAAAALGLVPRQNSSGGKQVLLGITKRGDRYLRSLLVHGARAYVSYIDRSSCATMSAYEEKIKKMLEKKHMNKVVVAVANRNARVMLALLKNGESYKAA
jgi:transposase